MMMLPKSLPVQRWLGDYLKHQQMRLNLIPEHELPRLEYWLSESGAQGFAPGLGRYALGNLGARKLREVDPAQFASLLDERTQLSRAGILVPGLEEILQAGQGLAPLLDAVLRENGAGPKLFAPQSAGLPGYLLNNPAVVRSSPPPLSRQELAEVVRAVNPPLASQAERLARSAIALPFGDVLRVLCESGDEVSEVEQQLLRLKESIAESRGLVDLSADEPVALYGFDLLSRFIDEVGEPVKMLLAGPPGNGKTLAARRLASRLKLMLLELRPTLSPWVGSSESLFESALAAAEQAAPAVVICDEFDRFFSGHHSSGDSGVMSRLVGRFLTWIERQKELYIVATTNATSLDRFDAALLRPKRLGDAFYLGPNPGTRREMLRAHSQELGLAAADPDQLAHSAFAFSGARLERAIQRALRYARTSGRRPADELRDLLAQEARLAQRELSSYTLVRQQALVASSQSDDPEAA